ncbi:threonine ammonia-lyase [uncultured Ferrimonas sp.]|uniref:threonine ammonia-lyase n=1 Tax=uncultured Ferrimonas sp. TaxID=432640 RepID=UPI00262C178B|nr:threonine ammonia-lyase [uncultured Ferrimonas sp.]
MVSLADIQRARKQIAEHVTKTPCVYSEKLSRITGCKVYLKAENRQVTGSYKVRGAMNRLLNLNEEQKAAGVVAASAGNHAQGLSRAAQMLGIKAVIVMPTTTPLAKVEGTKSFGGEVVLHGYGYDEAYQKAIELQQEHGYTFVHAFDDPDVIAGQGTIGLELLEQVPDLDAVVAPIGGGGVISGISSAVKALKPDVRILGVETENLPAMKASLAAGKVTPLPAAKTLADGISVSVVGSNTFEIAKKYVEKVVTVDEEEIANAILYLMEQEKTVSEGAGAVAVAALKHHKLDELQGKTVVALISGGNIDMNMISRIIERGLEMNGRLSRLRCVIADRPGCIAKITKLVADHGANIFDLSQSRPASDVALGQAEVDLTIEARGKDHVAEIVASFKENNIRVI